jgi:hypothetical protein
VSPVSSAKVAYTLDSCFKAPRFVSSMREASRRLWVFSNSPVNQLSVIRPTFRSRHILSCYSDPNRFSRYLRRQNILRAHNAECLASGIGLYVVPEPDRDREQQEAGVALEGAFRANFLQYGFRQDGDFDPT